MFWRRSKSSRATLTFALAAACALTSACARISSNGTGPAHELRIGIVSDPRSLNPLFVTAESDIDITQLFAETLVGLSPKNELIPLLANPVPSRSNGGISGDGLTITYHLRRDARFSDGVPVTSKDVAFTYRVILDPRNPVTATYVYKQRIASLQTPDAHTVVVRLARPWVAAVSDIFAVSDWTYGILPAHLFSSTDISHASYNERPIGSGPFRVVEWRHGDEIQLEPNPYAWRKPRLSRLSIKVVVDQTTLLVELRTHEVDVAALTEEQVAQVRSVPGIRLTKTPQNHVIYLEFQVRRPALIDPLVRQALTEGINLQRIRRNVFLDLQPLATTEIPPIFSAHDPSVPHRAYRPERAPQDLERAGWHLRNGVRYKNGQPLSLIFAYVSTSVQARRLALVVQSDFAKLGVELIVKGYPSTTFFGAAANGGIERGGNFDIASTEWYGGSDPEESEFFTCANLAPDGPNTSRWCDQRYDDLFARQAIIDDAQARRKIFFNMEHVVYAGLPADFLVYTAGYTASSTRLQGWAPNMLMQYGNSQDWDVAP